MPNFHWTFIEEKGKTHRVGLFHGKNTGHVLIHCNGQILKIDFNVFESKTYSFFINEELIELELDKKGDTFYYRFHINKEADTPRNQFRKKKERQHFYQTILFFGGFALLVSLGVLFFTYLDNKQEDALSMELLDIEGDRTLGFIDLTLSPSDTILEYQYIAEGRLIREKLNKVDLPPNLILANGFPLQNQDEFVVVYKKGQPRFHKILWDEPSEKQMERYVLLTKEKHRSLNPEKHPGMASCEVEVAVSLFGMDGLLDLFNQDRSEAGSFTHNKRTFERLFKQPAFQQGVEKTCWE